MHTLKQKIISGQKRELKILDTKLYYRESKFQFENELNIPFEDLTIEKTSFRKSNPVFLVVSILCAAFFAMSIFYRNDPDMKENLWFVWLLLTAVFVGLYYYTAENSWKIRLHQNTYIFIYKNSPDKNSVDQFIKSLFDIRNKYLRDNYMKFDGNLNYENQVNILKWLKRIEVITPIEFEEKYEELREMYNPSKTKKPIGFDN